jgi:hypothetical protein
LRTQHLGKAALAALLGLGSFAATAIGILVVICAAFIVRPLALLLLAVLVPLLLFSHRARQVVGIAT